MLAKELINEMFDFWEQEVQPITKPRELSLGLNPNDLRFIDILGLLAEAQLNYCLES